VRGREALEGKLHAHGFTGAPDPVPCVPQSSLEIRNEGMRWAMCAGTNRGFLAKDAEDESRLDLGALTAVSCSQQVLYYYYCARTWVP
jgi:hypothetical protein